MTTGPDHDSLLADVLAETEQGSFHAELLEATLGHVRRRRRVRLALRTTVPLLVIMIGMFFARWNSLRTSPSAAQGIVHCPVVHPQPLPVSAIVATQHFDRSCLVVTTGFAGTVHTRPGLDGVRLINDSELLALVGLRPAVLVRVGPNDEELIFVDRPDKSGNRL